jgi:hypothetical protein
MEWEASGGEKNGPGVTLLSYSGILSHADIRGDPMRLASRLTRLVGTLPYSLAVGAVGFAYLSPSTTADRLTPVAYGSAASRIRGAKIAACKGLSIGKQVQAVKDFAEMLPVFRHPRCNNCHGGLEPTSDRHPGKDQLDPNLTFDSNKDEYLKQCQDCHDGLPGWMVPPIPALFFEGKDDETLCKQMKQFEKTGDLFVEHILNDHNGIQFIAAGFKGDRALGEGLRDYNLVAEPPPGSQTDLTAKAQKWVTDLGGHYTDSPECGCVVPKVKLEVHNVLVREVPNGLPSKEASDVKFEVNLLPLGEDRPGGYQGDVSLVRRVQVTVPGNCKVEGNAINEHWTFFAILQPDSDSMQVWHIHIPEEAEGEIGCMVRPSGGWGNRRLSGSSDTVKTEEDWTQSRLANARPFMMPSDSGATKEFTGGDRAGFERESLSITVLAVPDK